MEEEIRNAFEATVLDLPRAMLVQFPHLLHDVHVAVVVVDFTLAATRDAIRILSWLRANAPHSRVIVVANKVTSGVQEISRKDFEASIERKVDIAINYDPKLAAQAAKLGQPYAKTATGKALSPLAALVKMTVATVEDAAAAAEAAAEESGASSSLLGRFNFKSLVAKKPKTVKAAA